MTAAAERGSTMIAERAVRRIAAQAAREADLTGRRARAVRASASVRGPRTDLAVDVCLPYPAVLAQDGATVRERIVGRVTQLTGLTVGTAQVRVHDLDASPSGPPQPAGREPLRPAPAGRPRRPWSQRRLPASVAALIGTGISGLLLYDLVSVHALGRRPEAWRTATVDWLATHGPGDAAVVAGGTVVAAAGVWLIFLALTPGLRGLLVMSPAPQRELRAVLERSAAAELVRDAVDTVPGVTRARVRVGRRRVRVRARLGYGDRDAARAGVRTAAQTALAGLGLVRTPRLRVAVRTEPHWRPPENRETGGTETVLGSKEETGESAA